MVRLLWLDPKEAAFDTRGFSAEPQQKSLLETAAGTFVAGYNAALSKGDPTDLLAPYDVPRHLWGFFVEGAGMALAITDAVPFRFIRGQRLSRFLGGAAAKHPYLTAVGAGWAMAKTPWRARKILHEIDPLLSPLAFDGLGFHDCFFSPAKLAQRASPRVARWGGQSAVRSWDRGAGRCLWFISGGDPEKAWKTISALPQDRWADILAGLGLAMTYAGGLPTTAANDIVEKSAAARKWLAQGAAFALEAHARAGTAQAETFDTFEALSGVPADVGLQAVHDTRPRVNRTTTLKDGARLHDKWRRDLADTLDQERGDRP